MINWRMILAGFLSAAVTDVSAWLRSGGRFDWFLALQRWFIGAVAGQGASFMPVE